MGLYDRDYTRESHYEDIGSRSEGKLVSFVKETYKLFAASMMAGAAGAYIAVPFAATVQAWFLPIVILEFVFLFGLFCRSVRRNFLQAAP